MFNLKRKVKQVIQATRNPETVIQEIHESFDSASERLLNEAKSIIANADLSKIDKAERLKKIGFGKAKDVTESEEQIRKQKESKDLADTIMYFKQWYPYNKFITEKEVKTICEKYELVFAEAQYYIGNVPDKNLKEIESFILRDEDKEPDYDYDYSNPIISPAYMPLSMLAIGASTREYLEQRQQQALANQLPKYRGIPNGKFIQPAFKMCAPEKDFNIPYATKKDGYMLIPDPIVLQPVKKGYLIVTKWGLEASDEMVINEIHN